MNGYLQSLLQHQSALRHTRVPYIEPTIFLSAPGLWCELTGAARHGIYLRKDGAYTLAQRIRSEGRLALDLLQRFGEEPLVVTDWLEQNGISHRDSKPDNIGVGKTPSGQLTLPLFDFSLANTPVDNIGAGTPPYLDPFLRRRKPPLCRTIRHRHDPRRDGNRDPSRMGRWNV